MCGCNKSFALCQSRCHHSHCSVSNQQHLLASFLCEVVVMSQWPFKDLTVCSCPCSETFHLECRSLMMVFVGTEQFELTSQFLSCSFFAFCAHWLDKSQCENKENWTDDRTLVSWQMNQTWNNCRHEAHDCNEHNFVAIQHFGEEEENHCELCQIMLKWCQMRVWIGWCRCCCHLLVMESTLHNWMVLLHQMSSGTRHAIS